ncbi:MAG: hypothetical protein MI863_26670 [Desulfobacterales bacterium]|nr:hypothetical protein [Desulfobacterales bacterium]
MIPSLPKRELCFGKIDHLLLIGGGASLYHLARHWTDKGYRVTVFSANRHLEEDVLKEGSTLKKILKAADIDFRNPEDINTDPVFRKAGEKNGMGIGFGETWSFTRETVERFRGRLVDVMGIRLPQYRGGAHYTWQILRGNKTGAVKLQLINEDMVQGEFDSGEIVFSKEFFFPDTVRIPADYQKELAVREYETLKEFMDKVAGGACFPLASVQEEFSIYFPRLHTKSHGLINWEWDTEDIEKFIRAFDEPYPGASTYINNRRVFLKKSRFDYSDGPFHPFQQGMIYRLNPGAVFIATRNGTLIIRQVLDEDGEDVIPRLRPGDRFFTPRKELEAAMQFRADYDGNGLKK